MQNLLHIIHHCQFITAHTKDKLQKCKISPIFPQGWPAMPGLKPTCLADPKPTLVSYVPGHSPCFAPGRPCFALVWICMTAMVAHAGHGRPWPAIVSGLRAMASSGQPWPVTACLERNSWANKWTRFDCVRQVFTVFGTLVQIGSLEPCFEAELCKLGPKRCHGALVRNGTL